MSAEAPARHELLALLDEEDRNRVVAACEPIAFSFGDVIMRQGEPARDAFILVSGRARVVQEATGGEEVVLATVGSGEVIGEMALLQGGSRTATVRACGDVHALRLSKAVFEELRSAHPQVERWLEHSTRARQLFAFLKSTSAFSRLSPDLIRQLVGVLEPRTVEKRTMLVTQGDPPGPMFLIREGRLRVTRTDDSGKSKTVAYLREGDIAGEVSLLRGCARMANVETLTDCKVMAIAPEDFRWLEQEWPEFRRAVEERASTYDFQAEARLPLDFSPELLPADAFRPAIAPVELEAEEAADEDVEEEPFATSRGLFRKRRLKSRFPIIRQVDEADCGVACLAMICRYHGRKISLTRLRALAHTSADGTTLRNLCNAAEELGLAARPLRVSKANVDDMPLPAVLHWENNHWVVLVEVTGKRARIADPAIGERTIPRAELDRAWNGFAAIFDVLPGFARRPGEERESKWGWLWTYAKPYLPTLVRGVALALVAALLTLALPVLTQVVVDRVVVGGAADALTAVLLALLAAFVFRSLASMLQGYLLAFVAVRLDASVLDYMARKLLELPLSYFQSRRVGDIQRRLDGARQVRHMIVSTGVTSLLAAFQVTVAVGLMIAYSPLLTLLFVGVAPIYLGLMVVAAKYLERIYEDVEAAQGKYRSEQFDALKGIEAVKASSSEFSFRESLLTRFLAIGRKQFKADLAQLLYQASIEAAGFLTSLLFLWLGARFAMAGELTLGGFVAFVSLVSLAVAPLGIVLSTWDDLQMARVLTGRLEDVLLSEPEQGRDRSRLLPVHAISGEIELRGVSFRYGGPESKLILRNLNLKVPAGKTVAIVGRSGSGKTTLVKLLAGLMEPTSGAVLYDGIDLRTMNYRDLRRRLGFVLQDTHLFAGSVKQNIALGLEPDVERVRAAARAAAAHEFIERLPLGYETEIGESGLRLSGGQAQRIEIARAIYRNPVVLIMDEATSALDTESERAILENMESLFQGRTVFVIAHRLSTIRDADVTVVLEQGEIVEQGSHQELMERRGLYYYLVSRQLEQ